MGSSVKPLSLEYCEVRTPICNILKEFSAQSTHLVLENVAGSAGRGVKKRRDGKLLVGGGGKLRSMGICDWLVGV